ncbi:hypothetical protein [Streptomyces sp. SBT349]|uniref:hypothetical protein n=1 Tax=Streptomyces sp. SBT349 TaxID=1580539 RepID=UPI000ADCF760|nr:hypothetical protein [Streptomyces sp. SBT349]
MARAFSADDEAAFRSGRSSLGLDDLDDLDDGDAGNLPSPPTAWTAFAVVAVPPPHPWPLVVSGPSHVDDAPRGGSTGTRTLTVTGSVTTPHAPVVTPSRVCPISLVSPPRGEWPQAPALA